MNLRIYAFNVQTIEELTQKASLAEIKCLIYKSKHYNGNLIIETNCNSQIMRRYNGNNKRNFKGNNINKNGNLEEVICFNCLKKEHFVSNCRLKKKAMEFQINKKQKNEISETNYSILKMKNRNFCDANKKRLQLHARLMIKESLKRRSI